MRPTIIALGPEGASRDIGCQLRACGYSVLEAGSPRDAGVTALLERGPALVVEEAPGGRDAIEALRFFRSIRLTSAIPYLVLTREREEIGPEVDHLQPFSVLAFPCRPGVLLREIQYLLERSRPLATSGDSWFREGSDPTEENAPTGARWKDVRMKEIWSAPSLDTQGHVQRTAPAAIAPLVPALRPPLSCAPASSPQT